MAPKPPDQKRKRGRPPGASKPTEDASRREQIEDDHDDVEQDSRPKKRGRKSLQDASAANTESKNVDEPAQPGRRGRPAKSKTQMPEAEVESLVGTQENKKNAKHKTRDTIKTISKAVKANTTAPEAQADEEPPSSEPRRSGREKRASNPEELYSASRSNHSPTQFTSPPSDSSRIPPPRRTKNSKQDSTPRRSARERRAWDAQQLFSGSRDSVEQQKESPHVTRETVNRAKGKPSTKAPGGPVVPKAQKIKENAQTATEKRRPGRPGRPPRNGRTGEGSAKPSNGEDTQAKEDAETTTANDAQLRRRGRPRRSDMTPQKSERSQLSRPRQKSSRAQDEQEEEQAPTTSKRNRSQPGGNLEVDEENNPESEEEEDELPFRHLKETTRNIPRSTISDKWTPLDRPSIDALSNFLADAQRPVLLRLQNTNQRRGHASSALGVVIRRLRSRLIKGVPFPAPTAGSSRPAKAASHEYDFDFERVVDAMQSLENTLNPLLHSVGLLDKQISKEEDALSRDYDILHRLETNAKAEAKEWRDKTRREHVLAPGLQKNGEQEPESRRRLELVPATEDGVSGGLFKNLEDGELVTLSKQIGSHMESMKGNLQPIDGVLPAIAKSKAALQQVLLKHLDDERYEDVLLGGLE
ncbi:hypothetical protein N0V82_005890 [Gnomoniopsis sp. IMI 355080]|nr:hypothetical protein N0V82_005890 [Gnomoniopsis sp. IMI 355080]